MNQLQHEESKHSIKKLGSMADLLQEVKQTKEVEQQQKKDKEQQLSSKIAKTRPVFLWYLEGACGCGGGKTKIKRWVPMLSSLNDDDFVETLLESDQVEGVDF